MARSRAADPVRTVLAPLRAARLALVGALAQERGTDDVATLDRGARALLDRLVFLRIGYARGIDRGADLAALARGQEIAARLREQLAYARAVWGPALFGEASDDGAMVPAEDTVLREVLARIDAAPFEALPPDGLGRLYELLLAEEVTLAPAGPEGDSPEIAGESGPMGPRLVLIPTAAVRKAGGVFYTPVEVVRAIVELAFGAALGAARDESGREGSGGRTAGARRRGDAGERRPVRVLDPACGSGSFLVVAFAAACAHRLQELQERTVAGDRAAAAQLTTDAHGRVRLAPATRQALLGSQLYGVDLDAQAAAATRLSLLIAALGDDLRAAPGETLALFRDRPLPDLRHNIRAGNSLVGPDVLLAEGAQMSAGELALLAPFDWEATFPEVLGAGAGDPAERGFDAVLGNPPYVHVKRGFVPPAVKAYLERRFVAARGQWDMFALFLERSLELVRPGGRVALLLPKPFLVSEHYEVMRLHALERAGLEVLVDMGAPFAEASVETVVPVLRRRPAGAPAAWATGSERTRLMRRASREGPGERAHGPDAVAGAREPDVIASAAAADPSAGDGGLVPIGGGEVATAAFAWLPFTGMSYLADEAAAAHVRRLHHDSRPLATRIVRAGRGLEIGKRSPRIVAEPAAGTRPLLRGVDVTAYGARSGGLHYVREGAPQREWKDDALYDAPVKVLVRRVASTLIAAVDEGGHYVLNTLYALVPEPDLDPWALAAYLNSEAARRWHRVAFLGDDRIFPYIRWSQLEHLPIPNALRGPAQAELAALSRARHAAPPERAAAIDADLREWGRVHF